MAAGEGWTSALLVGLAELLDAEGIGTWRPTGTYAATETGILLRAIPATPNKIITLTPTVVTGGQADGTADILQGVEVRLRGTEDPRVCEDLADAVFELLDGSGRQIWGTAPNQVSIVDVWRQSYTSLGQDGNRRWEASHNYYVQAMRPTPHRTD